MSGRADKQTVEGIVIDTIVRKLVWNMSVRNFNEVFSKSIIMRSVWVFYQLIVLDLEQRGELWVTGPRQSKPV